MSDLLRLDGQGAVVTGGARGIGSETALRLSEAGAQVALLDLDGRQAERTAREIEAESGQEVLSYQVDVSNPEELERCTERVAADLPDGIDIWINNAGIFPPEESLDVSPQVFSRILDVNLLGTQFGCELAAENMPDGGTIVNVSSSESFQRGAYGAAAKALEALTEGLASELGPSGIRVLSVAPTVTRTPGLRDLERVPEERKRTREITKHLPLGREGRPDDVARTILFLVSPAASFLTGISVPVDGGELAAFQTGASLQ